MIGEAGQHFLNLNLHSIVNEFIYETKVIKLDNDYDW